MADALSLEDRAAIEDRLGRYVWALDIGDPEAVAACFTADGVGIDTRGRRYEGPGAIQRFASEFINMPDFRGRQHQVTHLFFEGDSRRCVVTSYWTVVKWWVDEDRKGVVSTGWSRDTLVKTVGANSEDVWLMTERHLGWFSDKHCPWVGVGATEEIDPAGPAVSTEAALPASDDLTASIDAAKLTPRYWATFSLVVLQLVCEIFDFFIVGFLVSAIAPKWGLTFGQTTIILLSAGLGAIVGAMVMGWFSDRYGRKTAVIGGAVIYCLAAGAIALIPDRAWMLFAFLRFMVGVGYGGAGPSQFALIAEYTPTRLRTLMTSSLGIPASLGVVLASVVVSMLYPVLGWRGVAALGATPILVGMALAVIAPESPRWLAANGRGERARKALSAMLGREVALPPASAPAPRVPVRAIWSNPRRFWLIVLIQLGIGTAYAGVLLWGPTIVAQVLGVPAQKAATYFIGVSLAGTAGRFLFVWLPMKWGRVKSGQLMGYGGALFLALAAIFHAGHLGAVPLFLAFLVLGQVFFDGGFSNINPYAPEIYPVKAAALGTGLAAAAGGLGKILGPLVLGLIAGTGNLVTPKASMDAVEPGFLFLAGACLVAGLAYSFLGVETHGRPIALE